MTELKPYEEVLTTLDYMKHTKIENLWYTIDGKNKYGVVLSESDVPEVFRFDKLEHVEDPKDAVNKKTIAAFKQLKTAKTVAPLFVACEFCGTSMAPSLAIPVGVPVQHMVCTECSEKIAAGEIDVSGWFPEQEQVDTSIATSDVPTIHVPKPVAATVQSAIPQHNPPIDIKTIKKYICPTATDKEAFTFMQLCKARNLNPFTNEAYLLKYGNGPATIVVGKDAFTRRAEDNPNFDGFEAGIIVSIEDKHGTYVICDDDRHGTFYHGNEKLLGGWAKVYRKDHTYPVTARVSMKEYSTGKSSWAKIPATMIRKVALVQALREAFPSDLGGCYDSSEMGTEI